MLAAAVRRRGHASAWTAAFTLLLLAGCDSNTPGASPAPREVAQQEQALTGYVGVSFVVSVYRPSHGMVRSDDGRINCGTTATVCEASFPWTATAILRATPDTGYGFQSWAGDCGLTGPCVLDTKTYGADKYVVAVFEPIGSVGHGNWTSPTLHGPGYFDYLGNAPGAIGCPSCHGANLAGMGIAPGCFDCHARAGWAGWQTNCSFCHGARNASTMPGYVFASHPAWSAPPDAISQRLTGTAAPDRSGAHQAHLTGVTAGGLSFAPAFTCATCHTVPTDLSHVRASGSRAIVSLSGAGQAMLPASLGTYDPASGTCATYCHGASPSPAWSATGLQCGGCHALPPPKATTGHPEVPSTLTGCSGCHPDTMDSSGALLVGGKHLDGQVQATGGHGDYSSPAVHGPEFFSWVSNEAGALDCGACHGADLNGGAIGPSCTVCHVEHGWTSAWPSNCSFCHGARSATTMAGYDFAASPAWSAPPDAISQRLTSAPAPEKTGAHQAHLLGATSGGLSFALPFACETCHPVPGDLSHISGKHAIANVTLRGAGQGSLPELLGSYELQTGTCSTYCHGSTPSPAWAATGLQCGDCHGVPPAGHPSGATLTSCAGCHPDTMNADGTLNVAGGRHLNGTLDASGGHGEFSSPATHGPQFFQYLGGAPGSIDCKLCHGASYEGTGFAPSCNACHATAGWASWQTNCSFCHGARNPTTMAGYAFASYPQWSAPPDALSQRLTGTPAPARTGGHQAHLTGFSGGTRFAQPFACATCHIVPGDLAHAGGPGRAPVDLFGAGQGSLPADLGTYDPATGSCTTYCHGTTLLTDSGTRPPRPTWASGAMSCSNSCHGEPPSSGQHDLHIWDMEIACTECHSATVDYWPQIVGTRHVDGVTDVVFRSGGTWSASNWTCAARCHASRTMSWR